MKAQQVLDDALASVRAEGKEPTMETVQLVAFAIEHKLSWNEVIEVLKLKHGPVAPNG